MKNDKKIKGIYLDSKTNTYYVSTTFVTMDGYNVKKCKRGFKTKREADNWKQEQKLFYSKNMYSSSGAVKTPSECLLERYLEYKVNFCKPKTYEKLSRALERDFIPFFKNENMNELTPTKIQEYYLYITNMKTKNQSKNVLIAYINGFIDWLDLMELLNPSVARKFKLIVKKFEVTEEAKNDYLEIEEIKTLLDSYGTSRDEKMKKLMIKAFILSGLRHSEMRALTYGDIDFTNYTISVNKQLQFINNKDVITRNTKTNKDKIVDIPQSLVNDFKELMELDQATASDFIFTINDNVVTHNYTLQSFQRQIKKCGINKQITIHDLRHTYCTMLFDSGLDEKYISKQLGHASPKTSHEVYEHLTHKKQNSNKNAIETLIV